MNQVTFKNELLNFNISAIKHSEAMRAYKTLITTKNLNTVYLSSISEAASLLLAWAVNTLKRYAGSKIYKDLIPQISLAEQKMIEFETCNDVVDTSPNENKHAFGIRYININTSRTNKNEESKRSPSKKNQKSVREGYYLQSKQLMLGNKPQIIQAKDSLKTAHSSSILGHSKRREKSKERNITFDPAITEEEDRPLTSITSFINDEVTIMPPFMLKDVAGKTSELPETEEEIQKLLDTAVLEEQPTDILIRLAEKLKEKRLQQ